MDSLPSVSGENAVLVVSLEKLTMSQRIRLQGHIARRGASAKSNAVLCHHLNRCTAPGPASLLPDALEKLACLLKTVSNLEMVVTFGVSAHLATIEAYGMSWARVPFRPGKITVLPDGLILANLAAPVRQHIDTMKVLIAETFPVSEPVPTV